MQGLTEITKFKTVPVSDKDGNKKYITEVQVNELLMLGAKSTAA